MILILTSDGDTHADRVQAELAARGAEVARFDPEWFPREAAVAVAVDGAGGFAGTLAFRDRVIELDRVRTVWRRRPGRPAAEAALVARESAAVLADPWSSCPPATCRTRRTRSPMRSTSRGSCGSRARS